MHLFVHADSTYPELICVLNPNNSLLMGGSDGQLDGLYSYASLLYSSDCEGRYVHVNGVALVLQGVNVH